MISFSSSIMHKSGADQCDPKTLSQKFEAQFTRLELFESSGHSQIQRTLQKLTSKIPHDLFNAAILLTHENFLSPFTDAPSVVK
jgi:hypothetical protein